MVRQPSIGAMRDRITIQSPVTADDGTGGQTVSTYATVGEAWAAVEMHSGAEAEIGAQITATAVVHVRLRWRSDLSVAHRVLWRDRTLEIHAVLDDPRKRFITLTCTEVQA